MARPGSGRAGPAPRDRPHRDRARRRRGAGVGAGRGRPARPAGDPLRDRGRFARAGLHRLRRPPLVRRDDAGAGAGQRSCGPGRGASRRLRGPGGMTRSDPLLPNALLVARREYAARVESRLFVLSTVLLALLAVAVAFTPLLMRVLDRGTTTSVGVYATDAGLADRAIAIMSGVLNGGALGDARPQGSAPAYAFIRATPPERATGDVADG